MTAVSGPSIDELVLRFYQPGNPLEIKQIENHLRDLQRSPQGWEMADYLLGRDNASLRFFGALTFQVKLHTDSTQLDDAALLQVGQRLINWLVTLVDRSDTSVTTRKLCSTIAYYCTLDRECQVDTIIRRVTLSLAHNKAIDFQIGELPEPSSAVESLNNAQIKALLWLLTSLTEEVGKESASNNPRTSSVIASRIERNLPDAVNIIRYCFSTTRILDGNSQGHELQVEAMSSLNTWIFYAQKASWSREPHLMKPLQEMMDRALDWFESSEWEDAADPIADVLFEFPVFFTPAQKFKVSQIILSPWVQECLQVLLVEPAEELPRVVRLLLGYADQSLRHLAEHPHDPLTQQIMASMHTLLRGSGFAGVDDVVAVEALEFWTQFVEYIADAEFEDPDEPKPWMASALDHVMQIFLELWKKVKLPTPEQLKELDIDKTKEFRQFRVDVKELLVAAYPSLRSRLTAEIARVAIDSLARRDWLDVEASLFCLNAISIAEQEGEDAILGQLFGSPLFVHLKDDDTVPARARATGVDVLGQYSEFFERHTEYVPSVLDFLFSSLQSAALAQKSAKAINRLCYSCRSSLVEQLPVFLQAYKEFLGWQTAEVSTKEKVIGGIAAIAQALPTLEDQAASLTTLLDFVQIDLSHSQQFLAQRQIEEAQVASLASLRCLASIGKAFQSPNDEPLEPNDENIARQFWYAGRGNECQTRIFGMIAGVLDMFSSAQEPMELHGDVIEAVCNIFKAGFTESKPGPFVFLASAFVDLFSTMQLSTPRLEMGLATACSFLRSHSHSSSPDVMQEAVRLLGEALRLIRSIPSVREEDNTSGLLEVLERFMPRYTSTFFTLSPQDLETLFVFPLECLDVPEPLPKRAAAQFWTTFLSQSPARSKVSQAHLDDVVSHFGPRLALAIVRNVAGGCSRTDLDWFVEPLKKFSTRILPARKYLEEGLAAVDTGPAVGADAKVRFLKQLAVANNASTAKKVVTNFWSQCRGFDSNYAP